MKPWIRSAGAVVGGLPIWKGTPLRYKRLQTCIEFAASGGNQTSPDPRCIHQRISAVEANHKGVDSMASRCEAADYELLSNVESPFNPCSGSLAGFVVGSKAFGDDSLSAHLPDSGDELGHRTGEMLGQLYSLGLDDR